MGKDAAADYSTAFGSGSLIVLPSLGKAYDRLVLDQMLEQVRQSGTMRNSVRPGERCRRQTCCRDHVLNESNSGRIRFHPGYINFIQVMMSDLFMHLADMRSFQA